MSLFPPQGPKQPTGAPPPVDRFAEYKSQVRPEVAQILDNINALLAGLEALNEYSTKSASPPLQGRATTPDAPKTQEPAKTDQPTTKGPEKKDKKPEGFVGALRNLWDGVELNEHHHSGDLPEDFEPTENNLSTFFKENGHYYNLDLQLQNDGKIKVVHTKRAVIPSLIRIFFPDRPEQGILRGKQQESRKAYAEILKQHGGNHKLMRIVHASEWGKSVLEDRDSLQKEIQGDKSWAMSKISPFSVKDHPVPKELESEMKRETQNPFATQLIRVLTSSPKNLNGRKKSFAANIGNPLFTEKVFHQDPLTATKNLFRAIYQNWGLMGQYQRQNALDLIAQIKEDHPALAAQAMTEAKIEGEEVVEAIVKKAQGQQGIQIPANLDAPPTPSIPPPPDADIDQTSRKTPISYVTEGIAQGVTGNNRTKRVKQLTETLLYNSRHNFAQITEFSSGQQVRDIHQKHQDDVYNIIVTAMEGKKEDQQLALALFFIEVGNNLLAEGDYSSSEVIFNTLSMLKETSPAVYNNFRSHADFEALEQKLGDTKAISANENIIPPKSILIGESISKNYTSWLKNSKKWVSTKTTTGNIDLTKTTITRTSNAVIAEEEKETLQPVKPQFRSVQEIETEIKELEEDFTSLVKEAVANDGLTLNAKRKLIDKESCKGQLEKLYKERDESAALTGKLLVNVNPAQRIDKLRLDSGFDLKKVIEKNMKAIRDTFDENDIDKFVMALEDELMQYKELVASRNNQERPDRNKIRETVLRMAKAKAINKGKDPNVVKNETLEEIDKGLEEYKKALKVPNQNIDEVNKQARKKLTYLMEKALIFAGDETVSFFGTHDLNFNDEYEECDQIAHQILDTIKEQVLATAQQGGGTRRGQRRRRG